MIAPERHNSSLLGTTHLFHFLAINYCLPMRVPVLPVFLKLLFVSPLMRMKIVSPNQTDCSAINVIEIPTDNCSTSENTILPHLAMFLVTVWLVLMFFAFWWFEYRLLQPFAPDMDEQAVFFDGEQTMHKLAASITAGDITDTDSIATVIHFWDQDCPCNKLNESHVKDIIKVYGEQGVNFVIVTKNEESLASARELFTNPAVVQFRSSLAEELAPPSSPAAVVMNNKGEANYFGPYSVGARCLSDSGTFVENILDGLLAGKNRTQINTAAIGCFCDWNEKV